MRMHRRRHARTQDSSGSKRRGSGEPQARLTTESLSRARAKRFYASAQQKYGPQTWMSCSILLTSINTLLHSLAAAASLNWSLISSLSCPSTCLTVTSGELLSDTTLTMLRKLTPPLHSSCFKYDLESFQYARRPRYQRCHRQAAPFPSGSSV
eukprot:UN1504